MTLNKLAWEMWEKLGFSEVDPSVLSRVLQGERLFTYRQLKAFSKILFLSEHERKLMYEAYYEDLGRRFGLYKINHIYFIDLVKDNIEKIRQANMQSLSVIAEEWADLIYEKVLEEENSANTSCRTDDSYQKELLRLESRILNEKIHLNFRTKPLNQLLKENIKIARRLKEISIVLKDNLIEGIGIYGVGDAFLVSKKYKDALKYLHIILKINFPDREKYYGLRAAALAQSYLGNEKEYLSIKKHLTADSHHNIPDYINYQIYEGIARSEARFGNQNMAFKALSIAKKYLDKDHEFMREMQVKKAEIEIGMRFGENKNYLRKVGKEAVMLATRFGHVRYKKQINAMLY